MEQPLQLLYLDRDVVVCRKPVGVVSEAGGNSPNLPALVSAALAAQGEEAQVYTVHRLDREVGGLSVLARTHEAAAALIAQFSSRSVEKEYCAVLRGRPAEEHAVLEDLLFRDAAHNKSYVVKRARKGVRPARLEYVLQTAAPDGDATLSLVRIRLFTGRTHQIRVQFSSRGLPLLGDGRYGGRDPRCQVTLFACRLAFDHPATGRRLCFTLAPDETKFPWNVFPAATLHAAVTFSNTGRNNT